MHSAQRKFVHHATQCPHVSRSHPASGRAPRPSPSEPGPTDLTASGSDFAQVPAGPSGEPQEINGAGTAISSDSSDQKTDRQSNKIAFPTVQLCSTPTVTRAFRAPARCKSNQWNAPFFHTSHTLPLGNHLRFFICHLPKWKHIDGKYLWVSLGFFGF